MKEILERILELLEQLTEARAPAQAAEEGMPSMEAHYWTRKEVAAVLRVSDVNTAKALIKKAHIPEYKHGKEFVIHPEDFLKAYESRMI